jgi:hypothetical protein
LGLKQPFNHLEPYKIEDVVLNKPRGGPALVSYMNDMSLVPDHMPVLSYTTLEETTLLPKQDLSSKFKNMHSGIAFFNGHIVMYNHIARDLARELYVPQFPWDLWDSKDAIHAARQILAPSLTNRTLVDMPMRTVMKLYSGAIVIPPDYRGPVQKRLVTCIAILARDGRLSHEDLRIWIRVHTVVHNWFERIVDLPKTAVITLPDFSSSFQ